MKEVDLPAYCLREGCGDGPYNDPDGAFAIDGTCPALMPDFADHSSFTARVFYANLAVYDDIKDRSIVNGVTLANCFKTGVDNLNKTMGVVTGDAKSYDVFKSMFLGGISAHHNCYAPDAKLDFSYSEHLGWVPTCRSTLGTGRRVTATLRLPRLSA